MSAVVVLACAAAPASATSIQNAATGQEYTGIWVAGLSGNAIFASPSGNTITCNQSTVGGQITTAGSGGPAATGNINDADWRNSGGASLPCDDNITLGDASHSDFQSQNLPWLGNAVWLSDNTSGMPNGTFTFDGVRIRVLFNTVIGPINCDYVGDLNNTGATTRQLQGFIFNPDNTSGNTELRFDDAPLELVAADSNPNCDSTAALNANYGVIGQGGAKLQIRQNVASQPAANPPASTPSTGATAGQAKRKCKRKKGKKGAVAAKKKCKRKK